MENKEPPKFENENKQISQNKNTNWYSSPFWAIFGIVAGIASLISIPLAFYFYFESKEYPELTFTVHPVRAVLLQKGQSSNLSASFEGKSLEGDVTTAQVAVWNNGKKAIKTENILNSQRSIQIQTENTIPILEAKIRKVSREVVECTLNTEQIAKGIIFVSWQIFEQNDGCVIQIIYEGNQNVKFQVNGSIEGQNLISRVEPKDKIKSAQEQYDLIESGKKFEYFFFLIFVLVVFAFIWDLRKDFKNPRTTQSFKAVLIVGSILLICESVVENEQIESHCQFSPTV